MAFNWCFRHHCVLGGTFLLSLFSSSDHFASRNASLGDVSENVHNKNKSTFIPISMK